MSSPVIDVKNITKSFSGKIAVNKLNLTIQQGEVFGFLGPNGSGKTTAIRMLCGLLTPDSGEGTCLGYDIKTETLEIKKNVGYMPQSFGLYSDLTIFENLDFMARMYSIPNHREVAQATIRDLGLEQRANQLTGTLSGGWKQRVSLAACLLHHPKLLLLDEPTAGVDPFARRNFWDKIKELSKHGVTTLVSTHYMDEAERCDKLAYIAYGNLVTEGSPQALIKKYHQKNLESVFVNLMSDVRETL